MSLEYKPSRASNEAKALASPSSLPHPTGSQLVDSSGSPSLQVTNEPMSSNGLAGAGTPFNDNPDDELPPAYETVASSSSQILPPGAPPPQVNNSSNIIQGAPKTKRALHNQDLPTASSSRGGNAGGQNVYESPETTHIPISADPSTCFQRAPPELSDLITYERLPRPFVIQGKASKHKLPDLFPATGVPALSKHDVQESDWEYFIKDLTTCARYSTGERIVAGAFPVVRRLGPPGALITMATEQTMRKGKMSSSIALLDAWNEHFFKPRRLEAILCKGDKCKSGRQTDFLAPDRVNTPPRSPPNRGDKKVGADYRLVIVSI
ncbi:unnamed protein product [Rhizoctonia solani]|uniref:Uncharacterized protein n=1 Tax=Rhizoctonia solani TaxID=456999 RepID=A0A8H3H612_9AGAM|nr:unnamed protein product [Rhizoctonia solani]